MAGLRIHSEVRGVRRSNGGVNQQRGERKHIVFAVDSWEILGLRSNRRCCTAGWFCGAGPCIGSWDACLCDSHGLVRSDLPHGRSDCAVCSGFGRSSLSSKRQRTSCVRLARAHRSGRCGVFSALRFHVRGSLKRFPDHARGQRPADPFLSLLYCCIDRRIRIPSLALTKSVKVVKGPSSAIDRLSCGAPSSVITSSL